MTTSRPDVTFHDLLWLSSIPRVGPQKLRTLVTYFGSTSGARSASPAELSRVPGIDKKLAVSIARHDGSRFANDQLGRVERHKIRLISIWDDEYPDLLRKIYDPPVLLFLRGAISREDERALAIVGTRDPTIYGERIAEAIGRELARMGVTVVSGLARGIDTIAHRSVIKANGRTIGVVGSGLDIPYPPENKGLMETLAETGAVLSEFPLGTKPDAPNFPKRNRIISGLSLGTIVVESAEDGGAMITASTALDQNREVFAVPGPVTEKRSRGTNTLIRDGRAKLILSIDDILVELGNRLGIGSESSPRKPPPVDLTLFEQSLFDLLSDDPVHIDNLAERADTNTSDALVHLLSLEFKGLVRQLPGKQFVRA